MKMIPIFLIMCVMCVASVGTLVTSYKNRKHELKTEYTSQFPVKNKSEIESAVTNIIYTMSKRGFVTINLSVKRNEKSVRDSEFIVTVECIDKDSLNENTTP